MSAIQLSQEISVEPSQIVSVTLEEKGAKISGKVVTVSSGGFEDLQVPEDSLIVRLNDASEFVIRGEQEARRAWDQLKEIKETQNLSFGLNVIKRE